MAVDNVNKFFLRFIYRHRLLFLLLIYSFNVFISNLLCSIMNRRRKRNKQINIVKKSTFAG